MHDWFFTAESLIIKTTCPALLGWPAYELIKIRLDFNDGIASPTSFVMIAVIFSWTSASLPC